MFCTFAVTTGVITCGWESNKALGKDKETHAGFVWVDMENGIEHMKGILESNVDTKWEDVTSIIAGFSVMNKFEKVKAIINEKEQ